MSRRSEERRRRRHGRLFRDAPGAPPLPPPASRRGRPWYVGAAVVWASSTALGAAVSAGGWWWLAAAGSLALAVWARTWPSPYVSDREVLRGRKGFVAMLGCSAAGVGLIVTGAVLDHATVMFSGLGLLHVPYHRYGRLPPVTA